MTDRACAICAKRHELSAGALQCRAHPPVQDVARHAMFPTVRPDDYCHSDFTLDAEAAKALKAANAETARLDGRVAATQQLGLAPVDPTPPAPVAKRTRRSSATHPDQDLPL